MLCEGTAGGADGWTSDAPSRQMRNFKIKKEISYLLAVLQRHLSQLLPQMELELATR